MLTTSANPHNITSKEILKFKDNLKFHLYLNISFNNNPLSKNNILAISLGKCLLIYFIYTLFNVDNLQLLLYKDKIPTCMLIHVNYNNKTN